MFAFLNMAVLRCLPLIGAGVLAFGLFQPQVAQAKCGEYVQIGGEPAAVNSHAVTFPADQRMPISTRRDENRSAPDLPCSCQGSSCSSNDRNLPFPWPAKIRLVNNFDDVWVTAAALTEPSDPAWPSRLIDFRDGSAVQSTIFRPPR